jgi:acyl-CoA synthetase (AMP-forming)/AMP-acid ligase II
VRRWPWPLCSSRASLADDGELRDYLAQRLARYKLPRHWLRLDALPRTALGKVQRQLLAGLTLPASQTSSNTGTPRQAVAVKKLP